MLNEFNHRDIGWENADAGLCQSGFLLLPALRVFFGAADAGGKDRVAPALFAATLDGSDHFASDVGVRAIAEHVVEADDIDLGIGEFLLQTF